MKIQKLSDIIPDIALGQSYKDIAAKYEVSLPTIWRWVGQLKKGGFTVPSKKGRRANKL